MARQVYELIKEVTPGTTPGSPAMGTTTFIRLVSPVVDQPKKLMWQVRSAEGSNRRIQTGSAQNGLGLRISSLFYLSQAKLLIPAFCTPTGGFPGLTTFTAKSFLTMEDSGATKKYTTWRGLTPESLHIHATNSGEGVKIAMDMTFIARSFDHTTTLADPALTVYPADLPMVFEQLAGGNLSVGGRSTAFSSFDLTIKNVLDPNYDENANPTPGFYGSRDVDWKAKFRYLDNDFRDDYEAVAAKSVSFVLTDGTTTVTFNCNDANYYSDVADDKPFDKSFAQDISGEVYLDTAAGDDLTVTVAP